jgi:PhnB protein
MRINPYLQFGGRCAEAIEYYRQHLGAHGIQIMPFRGSPAGDAAPSEWQDKVMHSEFYIGTDKLMGSDGMHGQPFVGMQGASLAIDVNTPEEAQRCFAALGDGGTIAAALEPTFFARQFGMLTDRYGVAWMVTCLKLPPP